jgi:DNA-directed RNA polymerase specialized sigma24 family protein
VAIVNLLQLESDTYASSLNAAEMADELLVSAARSGDSCAFAELSKRHSQKLLLRAYRITDNWQDAEDVVQESLMRAFTHLNLRMQSELLDLADQDRDQFGAYAVTKKADFADD